MEVIHNHLINIDTTEDERTFTQRMHILNNKVYVRNSITHVIWEHISFLSDVW
jgi:hypothetical protein